MATQIRSGIVAILDAVKARLVDKLAFPEERIFAVARENVPHFVAEQDILLKPGRFLSKQEWNDGAGRVATLFSRVLSVIPRNRLMRDEGDRDDIFLTDADAGYFALEEDIVDALQDFLPENTGEDTLLAEPMRILGGDPPRKEHGDKGAGWGAGRLDFEIQYVFAADQTDQ